MRTASYFDQESSSPTTDSPRLGGDAFGASLDTSRDVADARFEAQSMPSLLPPLSRAATGVPFLYQRITSTSPITALIATKSPTTTFTVLHLDGTTDWMTSLANWGSSELTGRGLAALSAPGHTYQPPWRRARSSSHILRTWLIRSPATHRFRSGSKSTGITFQIPSVTNWLGNTKFFRTMRQNGLFKGPMTILMSSRGARISDVLTKDDVNEIADSSAGAIPAAVDLATKPKTDTTTMPKRVEPTVKVNVASVGPGWEDSEKSK
ncbi:Altered inheritance of mitochondria protein 24- mitochondrial [Apiospora aurea]|uniref:Altered inheritance of mitochondria protein 24-mitochondrial n=1 Tax=Apiospora aurea TaxID=335848 RepID=A0ABR1QAI0_9PEZI